VAGEEVVLIRRNSLFFMWVISPRLKLRNRAGDLINGAEVFCADARRVERVL
jgi:hypothetical protein